MEQAVRVAQVSKSGSTKKLVELGAGFERLQMVKDIARDKYFEMKKNPLILPRPDEIEIRLAYILGLKSHLDLPVAGGQEMRYRLYSQITDKDIRKAEETIKKRLDGGKCTDVKKLVKWAPLKEKLEDDYFGYVDDINDEYQRQLEALDSESEGYNEQLKVILTGMEMAVSAFYQEAVQKILRGTPLPTKTKKETMAAMMALMKSKNRG